MFAGPNGSGKSTLNGVLRPDLLGVYLNPDDMEREMRVDGTLDLSKYPVTVDTGEVREFFQKSQLLKDAAMTAAAERAVVTNGRLAVGSDVANSYLADSICWSQRRLLRLKR
jgi:hypothetical protein